MKGAKCPYCESKIPMFHVFFKGKNYTPKKLKEYTTDSKTNKFTIDYAFVISYVERKWEIVQLRSHGDFGKKLSGNFDIPVHFAVKKKLKKVERLK